MVMKGRNIHIVWFLVLMTTCGEKSPVNHAHHGGNDSTSMAQSLSLLASPVTQVVISSQKTIKPSLGMTEKSIAANGYISFDERRNNKVSVRSSGRIESLYIKYDYQYVTKGERIADLYSPELSTYQKEYLFLLKSKGDSLITQAREKLKLLGLSDSQINQVELSGIIASTIAIISPVDGFIRFASDIAASGEMNETASTEMGSKQEASAAPNSPSNSQIREGVYVSKGQTLFVVNDCREVWAILSFDISSQAELKKGEPVILYSEMQTEKVKATIDFIEPTYKGKQRFAQARVFLNNPLRTFKINSLIHGEFSTQTKELTVPLSSVYDLGSQKIVWVKIAVTSNGSGVFEPKVVMTGIATDNSIEIISGLSGDEEIALDAGYMIDSESILKQAP
jgi:Cu(I)/Ag(I) efflux system membrane fusion protein